jgi:hypothetical protein
VIYPAPCFNPRDAADGRGERRRTHLSGGRAMRLKSRARLQRVSHAREHVPRPFLVAGERTFQQLGRQGTVGLGNEAR